MSSLKFSSFRSQEQFEQLTVRQLKALCSQVNKADGLIICKAAFGKTYSQMRKHELVAALWSFRQLKLQAPHGRYKLISLSERVKYQESEDGEAWVHYLHCADKFAAYKLHTYLLLNDCCKFAAMRESKQFGSGFEIKVWGVDPSVLNRLINKDNNKVEQPSIVTDKVDIIESIDRWFKVIAEGDFYGKVGKYQSLDDFGITLMLEEGLITFPVGSVIEVDIESYKQTLTKLLEKSNSVEVKTALGKMLQQIS